MPGGVNQESAQLSSEATDRRSPHRRLANDGTDDSFRRQTDAHSTRLMDTQRTRAKTSISGSSRADSPTIGTDHQPRANHTASTNGTGSLANSAASLSRARKRARSETKRNTNHLVGIPLLSQNGEDGDAATDFSADLGGDDDGSSSVDDGMDGDRNCSSRPSGLSDEMQRSGTDLDTPYRGRIARPGPRQLPPKRRDSSLSGYGHHSVYSPATGGGGGGGTLPRRCRLDVSLTRATTIGGADPHGTLRTANRLAQSIRVGAIPPPPSEPPPATPLSGSVMSELGNVANPNAMLNPLAYQIQQQQHQQNIGAALINAAAAAGRFNPVLLNSVGGMSNPYMLNANVDQLLQQQQAVAAAAMVQQHHQQQQHQQQMLQSGLLQQTPIYPSALQNSQYGYPTPLTAQRADAMSAAGVTCTSFSPYVSAAALFSAHQHQQQQQQQQQQASLYQAHQMNANGIPIGLASPGPMMHPDQQQMQSNEPLLPNRTISSTGVVVAPATGSVVYENSYNSFRRFPQTSMPPSASQDGMLSHMPTGMLMSSDGISLSMNGASQATTIPVRNQTLGPCTDDGQSVALLPTLGAGLVQSPPPAPPPNHPSYDRVDYNYATRATLQSYGKSDTMVTTTPVGVESRWRCPWYYWIIIILLLAFLLALVLAILFSVEKQHLIDSLNERYRQDPSIIGLFNRDNPLRHLEPNKSIQLELDRMGVWSGKWRVPSASHIRFNITIASEFASIGLFLRKSTMPTVVHYDIFDKITGLNLSPGSGGVGRRTRRQTRELCSLLAHLSRSQNLYYPRIPSQAAVNAAGVAAGSGARQTSRIHYLQEGDWYLALVNDRPRVEQVTFSFGDAVMESGCPNDCSNRGVCNRGNCDCVNGFQGPDCSMAELPKVCSDHGNYVHGSCHCYPEWKGRECDVLWSECLDPACSGNGQCVTGECQCYDRFSGPVCEIQMCLVTNCSSNGVCLQGQCRCFSGWSGSGCEIPVPVMHTSGLLRPSAQTAAVSGRLDAVPPQSASARSTVLRAVGSGNSLPLLDARAHSDCPLDCGPHGACEFNQSSESRNEAASTAHCSCQTGWSGFRCELRLCVPQCSERGHCVNGTCVCQPGWNGESCSLDGCPSQCHGHGQCRISPTDLTRYECHCTTDWKGSACQTPREMRCNDEVDNDGDGLTDCLDPDCCGSQHCRDLARSTDPALESVQQSCAHSDSFHYRLLITPIAHPGSTFYGKLEFLLRRDGVVMDNFDPRRVSIIRGTVRQWDGTAFWGVRIFDRYNMRNGYTLTDEHGRFDLPVEGGSVVMLEFLRHPTNRFAANHHIYTPVNEIVNLGDFYLFDSTAKPKSHWPTGPDSAPVGGMLAASPWMDDLWISGQFTTMLKPAKAPDHRCSFVHELTASQALTVLTDHGVLPHGDRTASTGRICLDQEHRLCVSNGILTYSIPLHDTRLRLLYRSDSSEGYQQSLRVHLLDRVHRIPEELREIHVVFDVAGLREVRRLEPQVGLVQTFRWNKTDGYNRTVHGVVNARVSAGYVYAGCTKVFWEHRVVQLLGYELFGSELANWNLNAVHLYSGNHGIVYRGDGSHLFLKYTDWHVVPILGQKDGNRRQLGSCDSCGANHEAYGSPVLQLHSVITDAAGNVVVGDGAFLRTLMPSEQRGSSKHTRSADTLDARAQTIFPQTDRKRWFARNNATQLEFVDSTLDANSHMAEGFYYLAAHPNFLASQSIYDAPDSSVGGQISSGSFLSHTASRTIWWLADSRHVQPLVSRNCAAHDKYPSLTGVPCYWHALDSPKGLAASQGHLYFADGKFIWSVSLRATTSDKISPVQLVVGNTKTASGSTPTTPLSCLEALPGSQVSLQSPSSLVYSAFEDALYFADGKYVYRVHLVSQTVSLVAGYRIGCPLESMEPNKAPLATSVPLTEVRSLAIAPEGDLYIAEADRIWLRRADGRLHSVSTASDRANAGADAFVMAGSSVLSPSSANRGSTGDRSTVPDLGLAQDYMFTNITAIATSIYGELFVTDADQGLVYRLHYQLPTLSQTPPKYRIASALTDEAYVFNSHGQLLQTENAATKSILHQLDYRARPILDWLSEIRGNNVNLRFRIQRDTQGNVLQFRTPTGFLYNVTSDQASSQRFTQLTDPITGSAWQFQYSPAGLLTSVREPMETRPIRFEYALESGHLERVIVPNGRIWSFGLANELLNSSDDLTGIAALNAHAEQERGPVLTYGHADSAWTARFEHTYGSNAGPNVKRPVHLARYISLPDQMGKKSLENSVVWTSNTGSHGISGAGSTSTISRRKRGLHLSGHPNTSTPLLIRASSPSLARQTRQTHGFDPYRTNALSGFKPNPADTLGGQYQKQLVINGHPLLLVKFDWARQLETYQRASTGHVLLQIVYNANSQPVIFNASTSAIGNPVDPRPGPYDFHSGLPGHGGNDGRHLGGSVGSGVASPSPLRFIYTSLGQISSFQWGSASYRLVYDSLNRLQAANMGSPMDSVSFQYTDPRLPHQPSMISVSGSGQFKLFYTNQPPNGLHLDSPPPPTPSHATVSDQPIGLYRVITPSGLHREFQRITSLGIDRLLYRPWPGTSAGPWIYEWGLDVDASSPAWTDSSHRPSNPVLLRFIWPSSYRRIVHTAQRPVSRIYHDQTTLEWDSAGLSDSQPDCGQFDQLSRAPVIRSTDRLSGYRSTVWRTYRGALLTVERVHQTIPGARNAHPKLGGLLHARFHYTYNSNLNLVGIRSQLYAQPYTDTTVPNQASGGLLLDEDTKVKYDPVTGQMLSIRELDIVHRSSAVYVTYAPKGLQLFRQLDDQGRLRQVMLYPLQTSRSYSFRSMHLERHSAQHKLNVVEYYMRRCLVAADTINRQIQKRMPAYYQLFSQRDPLYNLSILYRPNSLDAVQQCEEQRGQVPRWVTFVHGPGGRLEAVDREESGSSLRSHTVLVHNAEGRIAGLRIAISDPQLVPKQLDRGSISRSEKLQFLYDQRGLLIGRGNWQYTFDEDGFLQERRLRTNNRIVDRFAYNSKGLLVWAERKLDSHEQMDESSNADSGGDGSGVHNSSPLVEDDIGLRRSFRVQYVYDALDRLVLVRDTLIVHDLVQYFYADPEYPMRVTHVFNHGQLTTYRLHYEPMLGHLISVEEFPIANGLQTSTNMPYGDSIGRFSEASYAQGAAGSTQRHLYFIITNQDGAPVAMISEDGKTTWTAEYSATGARRLNVATHLETNNVPLGHAGCLVDIHTGFLFCAPTMRAYDPLGATFTSPDWRSLLPDRLTRLYRDPSVLDTHKWGIVEQHHLDLGPVGLSDRLALAVQSPAWWLSQTGLNVASILPHLNPNTGRVGMTRQSLGVARSQYDGTDSTSEYLPQPLRQADRLCAHNEAAVELNRKIQRLTVMRPSLLTPGYAAGSGLPDWLFGPMAIDRVPLVAATSMFGSEVNLAVDNSGQVRIDQTRPSSSEAGPFQSSQLPATLLTQARLLDWWTEPNTGMLIQLFARPTPLSHTLVELSELGLKPPVFHDQSGHNLTVTMEDTPHPEIRLQLKHLLQWRIRFVPMDGSTSITSWSDVVTQIRQEAEQRGQTAAWAHEIQTARQLSLPSTAEQLAADSSAATQLLRLNHLWTYKQLFQLQQTTEGHVMDGYQWVPVVQTDSLVGSAQSRVYDMPNMYQLRRRQPTKLETSLSARRARGR